MKSIAASSSPNLFPDTWLAYVFANWMRLQRLTRPKGNPEGLSGFIRRARVARRQSWFADYQCRAVETTARARNPTCVGFKKKIGTGWMGLFLFSSNPTEVGFCCPAVVSTAG